MYTHRSSVYTHESAVWVWVLIISAQYTEQQCAQSVYGNSGTVCTIWTFTNVPFDLKVSPNLPYQTLLLPSCSTVHCSPTSRNCYRKWDMVSTVHAHIRDVTTCMRTVEVD